MVRRKHVALAIILALGALIGGIAVAVLTKAVPKIRATAMRDMIDCMRKQGCKPAEW